jgi:AcrR family transcriptional regulator
MRSRGAAQASPRDSSAAEQSLRTPGRKPPTELLDHLLDEAFDAFAEHGYEGASMRQIASEAGTTIQRIAYHFPSKEDLWKAVLRRVVLRFNERRRIRLEQLGEVSASVRLRHLITDMVHFLAESPGIHRIMTWEASRPSARLDWLCNNFLTSLVRESVAIIEAAQREGTVMRVDPARLHYAILSISAVPFTISAEFEATTGHDPFAPEEIAKTVDFILALVFMRPQGVSPDRPPGTAARLRPDDPAARGAEID